MLEAFEINGNEANVFKNDDILYNGHGKILRRLSLLEAMGAEAYIKSWSSFLTMASKNNQRIKKIQLERRSNFVLNAIIQNWIFIDPFKLLLT